jgi:hypothetical protein
MGILTLVALLAILIGFWQYSETLIGTMERQARDLASVRARNEVLSRALDLLTSPNVHRYAPDSDSAFKSALLWESRSRSIVLGINGRIPEASYELQAISQSQKTFSWPFIVTGTDSGTFWQVFSPESTFAEPSFFKLHRDTVALIRFQRDSPNK